MNWAQEQRIKWIGDMLHVYGFVNRSHIERMFRVSTPQASHDLKLFRNMHPGAAEYDAITKTYKPRTPHQGEE